jgi:hypothetical protein
MAFRIVAERDALESLPVLVAGVVYDETDVVQGSGLGTGSCPRSVIPHWRVEVPDWFYDDERRRLHTQVSQSCPVLRPRRAFL